MYTKAPTFRSLPECDNEIHVHQGGRSVVTKHFLKMSRVFMPIHVYLFTFVVLLIYPLVTHTLMMHLQNSCIQFTIVLQKPLSLVPYNYSLSSLSFSSNTVLALLEQTHS